MSNYPDFYTIGYSGRSIEQFVATLQDAGVKTLVDVRHLPLSRHKPDFSKTRLRAHLEQADIAYLHMRELGIGGNIRAVYKAGNLHILWAWYDNHVLRFRYDDRPLLPLVGCRRPFAIMCVEADPLTCHRHRLALALERLGLKGVDL